MPEPPAFGPIHWLITSYVHSWSPPNLNIFLLTDVLAHLQLHWTAVDPRTHLHAADTRGLDKMSDPKYCFVEWQVIDQLEPGETLEHTFLFPSWVECQTRYFTFEGTASGLPTASNSGIFSIHAFFPEPTFTWGHTLLTNKEVAGVIDHAGNSITASKIKPDQDLSGKDFNAAYVRERSLRAWGSFWTTGTLNPDAFNFSPIPVHVDDNLFPPLIHLLPSATPGSFLIPGVYRSADGKAKLAVKNIGTAPFTYYGSGVEQIHWMD